jgi:hypothetical protein
MFFILNNQLCVAPLTRTLIEIFNGDRIVTFNLVNFDGYFLPVELIELFNFYLVIVYMPEVDRVGFCFWGYSGYAENE